MEYNLLKTLDNDDYLNYNGEDSVIQFDDIIPGIGQIAQMNSFVIVPNHSQPDFTKIEKQNNLVEKVTEQLGGGLEEIEHENKNEIETQKEEENSTENDVDVHNVMKRKAIDPAIYQSFLHPKMFKTSLVNIEQKKSKPNSTNRQTQEKSDKKVKHKFNVY